MDKAVRLDVRLDTSLETLLERAPQKPGPSILATLVATAGSTYRKPGARMLILPGGGYHGLLSGGCLEADLVIHAEQVLASGRACAIEYDMRGPDDVLFGIGAGCEGAMRVLLEPAGPDSPARAALTEAALITQAGRATFLVTVHESTCLALGTYGPQATLPPQLRDAAVNCVHDHASRDFADQGSEALRAYVQFLAPRPHLLVCGGGPDAQPVVGTALALGWRVSLVDHRSAYALAASFPGATVRHAAPRDLSAAVDLSLCHAVVVMSHHLDSDVAYLRALACADGPSFVGLLGPQARRRRIVLELKHAAEKLLPRIRGPVGIDIGALTPEGIALSIISQIHAWLAGRIA